MNTDVVVVGAGIAGLVCAQRLQRAGLSVAVVDKSRGVGGRVATRRVGLGDREVSFDHGAQYVTAETDVFHRFLQSLLSQGVLSEWTRTLDCLDEQGLQPELVDTQKARYIAEPGMSAIAKFLASDLNVTGNAKITSLKLDGDRWCISAEGGETWHSKALILAMPAPQIVPLVAPVLPENHSLLAVLQSVNYAPSLAILAGYSDAAIAPTWKGIKWLDDPDIAWLAYRRHESLSTVVLHTTAAFAEPHLEAQPDVSVGHALLQRAAKRLEPWLAQPDTVQVHRWRYAFAIEAVGTSSVSTTVAADQELFLVCAGDWCAGNRVESAYLSGEAAATRVQRWFSEQH